MTLVIENQSWICIEDLLSILSKDLYDKIINLESKKYEANFVSISMHKLLYLLVFFSFKNLLFSPNKVLAKRFKFKKTDTRKTPIASVVSCSTISHSKPVNFN